MNKAFLLLPLLVLRLPATQPVQVVHGLVHVYTIMNEPAAGACFIFFQNDCDCSGTTEISVEACRNFSQYTEVAEGADYMLDAVVCPPASWVEPHNGPEILRVCNARFSRISKN